MDIVMTRSFNHIGVGQSETFVVPDFCKQAAEIKAGKRAPVIRVGNLAARRDFTDVRDVVRAYTLLSEKGAQGETYNIGSGKALSVREILDTIIAQAGVDIEVVVDEDRFRPIDVPVVESDTVKLRKATGWTPSISLDRTITDVLAFYSE
jgi:GDP-4-dehydro-6-deoxy-D-mannose reductase